METGEEEDGEIIKMGSHESRDHCCFCFVAPQADLLFQESDFSLVCSQVLLLEHT